MVTVQSILGKTLATSINIIDMSLHGLCWINNSTLTQNSIKIKHRHIKMSVASLFVITAKLELIWILINREIME